MPKIRQRVGRKIIKLMKKFLFLVSALICAMLFTSCEEKVHLESLSNTYWEAKAGTEYEYMHIWFYDSENCKVNIRTEKSDEVNSTTTKYKLMQSGYFTIMLFPGTSFEKDWIEGHFYKESAQLITDGGIEFVYRGKAK